VERYTEISGVVILIHQLKVRLGQSARYIHGTSYEHNQ